MLIKCPECNLQVSDKAYDCPHCGYPMKQSSRRRRTAKRKRLPNGFGQITEIKNQNLRKPFRAMVSVGTKPNGRPICKLLQPQAYFETYNEAYQALIEYNKNPFELDKKITVNDVFEMWFKERGKETKASSIWRASWKYCHEIYGLQIREIRVRHLRTCLDNAYIVFNEEKRPISPSVKAYCKSILNQMFDYAVEYELTDHNYARDFNIKNIARDKEENRKEHIPFTEEEMNRIWENINNYPCADMLLIQCYSGWRPQELCKLETENINLEEHIFIGGMKTKAGRDRIVPIHSKIYNLVKQRYDDAVSKNSKYLFTADKPITDQRYRYQFGKIVSELNLNPNHRAHDGRVHFVTIAKKYNVDEYAIKYMVGHSITDITEKIYTQRNINWLKEEIEKIR